MGTYDCPNDVAKSFPLPHSTKYSWDNNVVTFFYTDEDCDKKIDYIVTLLSILQPNRPLVADILLSPVKKYFPKGRVFGPAHINTGYASSEKIVVYRKEEWFKVFIHECFHYFNLDDHLEDPSFANRILRLFPVNSPVHIYESYCELWARRLNCYVISLYTKIPYELLLQKEKKHSMQHMVNVLSHMGLTYADIQKPNSGFNEHTNVLAYIVITNLMMQLADNPKGEDYIVFIEQNYKNPHFMYEAKHTLPTKTTTMSILSVDDF